MIPLEDESRRPSRFPVVTAIIIAVNALAFFLELFNGEDFVTRWALIPTDVVAGRHLVTMFSALFMHASWMHIIGNMIFLWAFGPEIEDAMGRIGYAIFYFAGGLASMGAQIAADPGATVPNLGASGAIAAVMGAFLVTYPRDRMRTILIIGWFVRIGFIPAGLLIGFWFLTQLVDFGAVADVQSGGVAYMAHIGGIIFGALTGRFFENAHWPSPPRRRFR